MSFPRYPEYKDSGVEWLGKVPAHWPLMRFKWQIDRNDGGVWGDDPDGENDTIVLRSTEQTVDGNWRLDDPATRKLTAAEKWSSVLLEGDLLVTKSSGSALHIGKTTLVTPEVAVLDCCYSNFMQRIRTNAGFTPRLAWYVMNNEIARVQFDLASNSTTGLANLNGTMIGELVLTVPSGDEQSAITVFLDHETAKIDALVAEQETLIALLKEKRQAVISHAVTKGLDPAVPMKDSGIEWLGQVPAHWEVCQLKRMTLLITDGAHISPETDGGIYDFVSTKDVTDDAIDFKDSLKTTPESYEYLVRMGCQPVKGDVLFSKDGTIGRTVVVNESREFVVASSLIIIRPQHDVLNPKFLNYLCQSDFVRQQVDRFVKGAGLPRLSIQNLLKVVGIFPPLEDQYEIAAFLGEQLKAFGSLAADAEATIGLLKERRSALISAAVTGKIDVRGIKAERKAA